MASNRARTLAARISSSGGYFTKNILNNTVHVIPLDKISLRKHAGVQLEALSASLNSRKVNNQTATQLGEILYNDLKRNLDGLTGGNISVTKIGTSPSDMKLRATLGGSFGSSTTLYRIRSTDSSGANIKIKSIIDSRVLAPANATALSFLNSIKLKAATIPKTDILDIAPIVSSSTNFNSTVRELVKSAQRLPKENRANYLAAIGRYSAAAVKSVHKAYKNADWDLQVDSKHDLSLRKLSAVTNVVMTFHASSTDTSREVARVERAALDALLNLGVKEFEKAALQDGKIIPKIEQLLVDSVVSAITKKKKNRNAKGQFISKEEVLQGITQARTLKGRSSVWQAQGREALADVTTNLLAIKNILNEFLPEYMERNMGRGNSKTVLNYRTGRLADSAEVLQVHPTRANMISASVRYMYNPYITFSPDGARGTPSTRNPKRLLDRSIRQILKEKLQIAMAFKSELR
jgi:hypothetical protein